MDARIILLSPRRCRLDLLEGDLIRCLEQREDALAAGRIEYCQVVCKAALDD